MNYGLLWLDALVASLLWVALLTACIARLRQRWLRIVLWILAALVPCALLGGFVAGNATLKFRLHIQINWFYYALSLLLAYLIGALIILWRGSRRRPALTQVARSWQIIPLVFAWLTTIVVGYITMSNMDVAIRARCAIISVKVNSDYLACLPAIVTENQNAAPLYERAFALLKSSSEKDVNNPPTGSNNVFDPNEPATIAFLKEQSGTIELLRKAAALPACRFDADLGNSDISEMLHGLNDERNVANVLNLDAREAIAHGRVSQAIADTNAIFEMSRQFGRRPLIISALVAWGIDAVAVSTLQTVLPSVSDLHELNQINLEDLPSLGRATQEAFRGEEAFALSLFVSWPTAQTRASGGSLGPFYSPSPEGASFRIFFLDLDSYLAQLQLLQESAVEPYYQIRDRLPGVAGTGLQESLFTSLLNTSFARVIELSSRFQAQESCCVLALAMTRFRLDHHVFPAALQALIPGDLSAIPTDPFDGKPMKLAVRAGRWIIYSVGPDGIDNGGAEMLNGKGDIIFTLPAPGVKTTVSSPSPSLDIAPPAK